jgi:hypothetical protein
LVGIEARMHERQFRHIDPHAFLERADEVIE